jgi:hypothetical protein
MDERTEIAAMAMEGILVGIFADRPTAKPTPAKVAEMAVGYADALRTVLVNWEDPLKSCPAPKV